MNSGASWAHTESTTETTRMRHRRRPPLHTCGVSILAMAERAYTKSQDFNGPFASMLQKIAKATFANPFVYALHYYWLLVLSIADDHILAVEDIAETIFPPSNYVFNKIDELVQITEHLPRKFEDVINKFQVIVHQVPFVEWALMHLISWLNFLITVLTDWGRENAREKEIEVDVNCRKRNEKSASVDSTSRPTVSRDNVDGENKNNFPPISDTPEDQINTALPAEDSKTVSPTVNSGSMKETYKEALEKGTKESIEKKEDMIKEEERKADVRKEEDLEGEEINEDQNEERNRNNDPILELFESGWHMKS